jgi:hypothetical protein
LNQTKADEVVAAAEGVSVPRDHRFEKKRNNKKAKRRKDRETL